MFDVALKGFHETLKTILLFGRVDKIPSFSSTLTKRTFILLYKKMFIAAIKLTTGRWISKMKMKSSSCEIPNATKFRF